MSELISHAYNLGETHILSSWANGNIVVVVNAHNYEDKKGRKNKRIQIQILMNKGFSSQYFGNDEKEIEGMLSLLCYIVLAEIIGKQRGFRDTHMVREYINAIIDSVPPTIN